MISRIAIVVAFLGVAVAAQAPEPPLADTRLTVHTLLREDIFAGFLENDLTRLSRAERNIDILLKERPDQRANLMAWRGAASLYRAVRAHEAGDAKDFQRFYRDARDSYAEARRLRANENGVPAVIGGTYSLFADRLPDAHRAAAWAEAYESYALMWKEQAAIIDKLPVHHRGEVLGGLVQAAQRTGRTEEMGQYLDRMLVVLAGTPYEATAQQWKADPAVAANSHLTCKSCHNPGRLAPRMRELSKTGGR